MELERISKGEKQNYESELKDLNHFVFNSGPKSGNKQIDCLLKAMSKKLNESKTCVIIEWPYKRAGLNNKNQKNQKAQN